MTDFRFTLGDIYHTRSGRFALVVRTSRSGRDCICYVSSLLNQPEDFLTWHYQSHSGSVFPNREHMDDLMTYCDSYRNSEGAQLQISRGIKDRLIGNINQVNLECGVRLRELFNDAVPL